MRRCAVAKASCSRLRSIKAPPCFDARITSKRVCALPHPRDPPDVSAPLRMETDDSEPPIIIIAPSVRETNEKRKGKGKKKKWAGKPRGDGVFDASDCVYLIGSGAQQRSIVDDRLLEYTRSYRSVVGDSWEGKDDIEVERMDDAASTIVGERRYLELILIGRYRWIVMVIVEDNLPSTMANIVARRLFIVNISRPTVPNIAYS